MSGIIALVGCGVYMTATGKTKTVSVEAEHDIHAVWSYIGFAAETIIFMITGFDIGGIAVNDFQWIWLLQLLGLYFFLHVIRFGFLMLVKPIFGCTGYPFSLQDAILVSYGGLRGAVGLALALMVTHSKSLPEEYGHITMFHISGIVLLTLTINGMTTGYVIKLLGLKEESKTTQKMIKEILNNHSNVTEKLIEEYKDEHKKVSSIEWQEIIEVTDI